MHAPTSYDAACLCGRIQFRINEKPRVHYCHCTMCQRATGSPAAVLGWVKKTAVLWGKEHPTEYRSSPVAVRSFCGVCGSPICLAYDGSDEVGIHLGCVSLSKELPPYYHYGIEGRLPWFDAGKELEGTVTSEKW
ncbi:GFA family protein [Taklimakanibacter albus]|uniref:GFA family protein n=1 Tax=Taklimakanibacter albus TaxID=2800327 RepID=UPI003B968360